MIVLGIGEVGQQQIKKSKVVLAGIAGLGFISFYNLATKA
jgi:molybdopterin/thiamine biosynthesis adenylyltransferase